MAVLDEKVKEEVKNMFKDLKQAVRLIVFTRDDTITVSGKECQICKDNETIQFEGALDKNAFLEKILQSVEQSN
ncbi:MAG: hypothetical protein WBB67_03860 [bacterium]